MGPVAPGGGSVPAESRGLRAPAEQSRAAPYSRCRRRRRAGTGERRAAPRPAGSMSGGRSGRAAVKMEAPFYPEEGLELLPDFVPLPGFAAAAGPGAEAAAAAGPKLLLGAGKKRDLPPAAPSPLPGPFALRPPGSARGSAAALRLLPPSAAPPPPPPGSAQGSLNPLEPIGTH